MKNPPLSQPIPGISKEPIGFWQHPVTIQPNNFVHKSLSNWAVNIAVRCGHACRFCYVPSAATNKMAPALKQYGVENPDAQCGEYALLREWNEREFLRSLGKAERTPMDRFVVRRSLELIRDYSSLRVRILTRSPLAK